MIWPFAIPPVLLGLSVGVHDFFEGERLIPDLWCEYRLARADIRTLDAACARQTARSDVIVSLTTIPSRIAFLADMLKSLMLQTRPAREIRLNLPKMSRREATPYVVPPWLGQLQSVRLVECEDYGPATKLLPTLGACPPGQAIVAVDDDRIYAPSLIADLEAAAARDPGAAFGLGGWIAPPDLIDRPTTVRANLFQHPPAPIRSARIRRPVAVDILQGMAGYLVRPGFFDLVRLMDYANAPPAAFYVDDVWISAHCRAPKFVIPGRSNFPPKRRAAFYKRSSLGWINRGQGSVETRNNTIMLKHLAADWKVGGPAADASGSPHG